MRNKLSRLSMTTAGLAGIVLTAALATPAAAQQQVPFKGSLHGVEIDTPLDGPPPTTISGSGTGTGIATHIGQFTYRYQLTANLTNRTGTGTGQFIAANGDSISMTSAGSFEMTSTPGVGLVTEVYTITGGTGRFAGAQGSFIVERLITEATGDTSGSFHGTITSPGSAR